MVYGIDLGTTNSLIGRDNCLMAMVSSSVDLIKETQCERHAKTEGYYDSYKVNMTMSVEGKKPIKASSIILKHLKDTASMLEGREVSRVVISVPASFTTIQREAVLSAAQQVGLKVEALINEPTAAALYCCSEQPGLVVVYDLGGGTFDISVVDNRHGSYSVVAFDGIILGGDDLDKYLADKISKKIGMQMRHKTAGNKRILKKTATMVKETISNTGMDFEGTVSLEKMGDNIPFTVSVEEYKEALQTVFGDTIQMTNNLIATNIAANEKPSLVLVGGSTMCPFLRAMVEEGVKIPSRDIDIRRDEVVARGVFKYATMMENGTAATLVEDVTKRLCIKLDDGRTQTIIASNSLIPCRASVPVVNHEASTKASIELFQGDAILAKDNTYIGTLEFEYGRLVEKGEGFINVDVSVDLNGVITLSCYEPIFGEETAQEIKLKRL